MEPEVKEVIDWTFIIITLLIRFFAVFLILLALYMATSLTSKIITKFILKKPAPK